MRPTSWLSLGFVTLALAACATSSKVDVNPEPDPNNPDGNNNPNSPDQGEPETVPHSLGTIILGETRAATTGDSKPIISASFWPDSKLAKKCTKAVGQCEVTQIPKCVTGTVAGCATSEVCTFDDSCQAKCVKTCTKACAASEECVFSPTAPPEALGMACSKKDRFDAGVISFAGATTSLTLFPPYSITPDGNGAPFMAQVDIRVQATGGTKAGFEKFDEKFKSTTFLQTDPPLNDLSRTAVFGSGPVTVGWVKGEDKVVVSVTGVAGTARCAAEDAKGTYEIPRAVLSDVVGTETPGTTPSLSLAVTRERREVKKGKKAFGSLSGGRSVIPNAWVEFVTSSTESHSFQSCQTGYTACGELCVNTNTDPNNCGMCGKKCVSPTPTCSLLTGVVACR